MVRTTLQGLLAQAHGLGDGTDVETAQAATATALAAELAAVTRAWVQRGTSKRVSKQAPTRS